MSNTSLLPGGADEALTSSIPLIDKTNPSAILTHCVLALLNCETTERPEVMVEASVLGFVYVVEVEEVKRRIKVLAPMAGRLPSRPLVVGQWPEATGNMVG